MKIINRFTSRSENGRKMDETLMVQVGQAYEIADLVTRYVQGNPPDISVNQKYTPNPSLDAPPIKYPFGADMVDLKEDLDRQEQYANSLLAKDNVTAEEKARARDIRARVDDAKAVSSLSPEPDK